MSPFLSRCTVHPRSVLFPESLDVVGFGYCVRKLVFEFA